MNTKLFVTAGKEKFVDIMGSVIRRLNLYMSQNANLDYRNVIAYYYDFQVVVVHGVEDDEGFSYTISIFPDCQMDYGDIYKQDKTIFHINSVKDNTEVAYVLIEAIRQYGDVYYSEVGDDNFVKVRDNSV